MIGDYRYISGNAGLAQVIKAIYAQLEKSAEVAHLIDEYGLRHRDTAEAARRVHAFTKAHVKYKLDPKGWELVRSAAQSWADREKGVDCEDLTILQGSLMKEMGHGSVTWMDIVNLDGVPGMDHIYPVIREGLRLHVPAGNFVRNLNPLFGLPFDSLMPFGKHPEGITESIHLPILPMQLATLGSLSGAEARKAEWLGQVDPESRPRLARIMKYVEDVSASGIKWRQGIDFDRVAREFGTAEGLGRRRQRPGNDTPPRDRPRRNLQQSVTRVLPFMVIGRNAFLALVALNGFHLATHLRIVFLSPDAAARSTLDKAKLAQAMAIRPKIEKVWKNLGGDLDALKKAIAKGAHIDVNRLSGLGEAVTATVTASALPVLTLMVPIIAAVPWKELGKDKELTGGEDLSQLATVAASAMANAKKKLNKDQQSQLDDIVAMGVQGEDASGPTPPPGGGGAPSDRAAEGDTKGLPWWGWGLIILGGSAVIGGGIYLATSSGDDAKKAKQRK